MNAIRQTQQLNKRELENAIPPSASWHADYRDTAYIYVGGLPLDLSEGDVVTIFSQYGNPTHLNLIRDKDTGKSKGFAFLKYEDQRSCDLAVDNLGGADVLGRLLRVDHTRYKKKENEDEDTHRIDRLEQAQAQAVGQSNTGKRASDTEDSEEERQGRKKPRSLRKEAEESKEIMAIRHRAEGRDDEDPMREYLVREKREKEEVERAQDRERKERHRHRHHHSHRPHKDKGDGDKQDRKRSHESRDHHGRHRTRTRERDRNEDDRK